MNLLLPFRRALSLWPDREAVVDGDFRASYAEFGSRTAGLAHALLEMGLNPGDAVALLAPNVHEVLEAYFACAVRGLVLAPVNHRLSPREMRHILTHSGSRVVIVHPSFSDQLRESGVGIPTLELGAPYEAAIQGRPDEIPPPPPIHTDTLAHLYYTSGTTGTPKGVMLTHGNVTFHALAAIAELGLSDADTWLHAAPLFHLADAWATFAITWVGGRHVCLPHFSAEGVLRLVEEERVTLSNWIPTMLNLMVQHPDVARYDCSSLRVVLSGGAPIAPRTVRSIVETFGCDYIQTYGMTETSPYLTVSVPKSTQRSLPDEALLRVKSRTGRPFIGVELRVVGSDDQDVARNDQVVGEVVVRGPTVSPGYWGDPVTTAASFRDGWLLTGDLATWDAEGSIRIVDRRKDVIITGGENVYSSEVEYAIQEHPDVQECAVIGVPDEKWGEAVKAFVVVRPGTVLTERDLVAFLRERLTHFKVPQGVEFLESLPRLGSGKVDKKALRA